MGALETHSIRSNGGLDSSDSTLSDSSLSNIPELPLSYNGARAAHEANSTGHSQDKNSAFVICFMMLKKRVPSVVVTSNDCYQ